MRSLVLHPFLFAAFGALALYAISTTTIVFEDFATLFIFLVGTVGLFWVLLIPFVRDRLKRGLLLTVLLVAYFFCVPLSEVLSFLSYRYLAMEMPYPVLLTALLLSVLVFALVRQIIRTKRDLQKITKFMNVFTLCGVGVAVGQAGLYVTTGGVDIPTLETVVPEGRELPAEGFPDVYYIILDGYVRSDVLSRTYGGDNGAFLDHLRAQGFYVAEKARSNYSHTHQSLASSLNFMHLTALADKQGGRSVNRRPLNTMIRNNAATKFLKERGYTFVSFSSGFNATEFKDADVYLKPEESLSEFESLLAMAMPIPGIASKARNGYALHRERIEYIIDTLGALPDREGPSFVFAHILAPHPPFVFGEDGGPKNPVRAYNLADGNNFLLRDTAENYINGYREQAEYITARLQGALDKILERSPDALIVVQGDHGARSSSGQDGDGGIDYWERLSILNAYHLPGGGEEKLYRDITPVNTFRVIFNHYFGTSLELLPDESYYVTLLRPYRLENVTERAKEAAAED